LLIKLNLLIKCCCNFAQNLLAELLNLSFVIFGVVHNKPDTNVTFFFISLLF